MEFYDKPSREAYVLNRLRWFQMPLEDGGSQTVVTVTTTEATYWVIAYTILLTSVFAAVAKLISRFVLTYAPLRGSGNRHVMLVTFFNASSPLTAAIQMIQYTYLAVGGSLQDGKWAINWDTLRFSSALCSIAVANIAVSQVSKFVVGGNKLVVRHAARANPSAIFYGVPGSEPAQLGFQLVQPLRATAAYQALGRLGASKSNVEKAVEVTSTNGSSADGPTFQLEYSYTITGADFGLLLATELHFSVVGHCEIRWDWVEPVSNISDGYPLFSGGGWEINPKYNTAMVDSEKNIPPWLNIVSSNDTLKIIKQKRGFEFAVVPNISHRRSLVPNTVDPWCMTEDVPSSKTPSDNPFDSPTLPYQVRRGRPPVFCYQNDTWSLGSSKVYHVDNLKSLPGLKLSSFLRDTLFPIELATPAIIQTGNNLGYAQLSSSLEQSVNQKSIYAGHCNTTRDIERLVQISYIASREIVRNTVLLFSDLRSQTTLRNGAAVNGSVPDEYADFILESRDVVALSVPTLLSVPIVCIFLWSIILIRGKPSYGMTKAKNTGKLSRHNLRIIALQAAQLYRYLDEQISGKRRWSGRATTTPFIQDIQDDCPEDDSSSMDDLPDLVGRSGRKVFHDHDTTSPFIKPKLVRIVGGPTRASLRAQPQDPLVEKEAPTEDRADGGADANAADACVIEDCSPSEPTKATKRGSLLDRMMFWRPTKDLDVQFELVMTQRWQRRLKANDCYVKFDEVLNDLPPKQAPTKVLLDF